MYQYKAIFDAFHNLLLILIGIAGIGFIIGFHELGHFIFGKIFKIKTPSFAVGFGPKIYKKKIGETDFSIGAIPLGGYVESDKESFESKPYWQKMFVFTGGIAFNLIFAYFIFCLIFALGLPKTKFLYPLNANNKISVKNSLNKEKIAIEENDLLLEINGSPIDNKPINFYQKVSDLFKIEKESLGKNAISSPISEKTNLKIDRGGSIIDLQVETSALINAALKEQTIFFQFAEPKALPLLQAIKEGVNLTNKQIVGSILMLKHMFVNRDTSSLGGPIAIISETVKGAGQGFKIFLFLLAIISISLAVINLIPLPILDGGQALLYTIEAIIRKRLSDRTKEIIFMVSWAFMLVLFVLISARDIWKLVGSYFTKK